MTVARSLAEQLDGTRDWTLKLLADVKGDDWFKQPGPGLAHCLWTCGHLAVAQHLLIHVRCLGKPFLPDSFAAHFPMGGPVKSAAEYDYPSVDEVRPMMADVHQRTVAVVRELSDEFLAKPAFGKDGAAHPHYKTVGQAIGHADRHEAFHAGQIALIRRLLGKPFLR